jgi:outer membrane autotransporter protein
MVCGVAALRRRRPVWSTLLLAAALPAAGAPVILPPNATPNTIAIGGALQRVCDRLSLPASGQSLTLDQQDLLQRCTFFEDAGSSAGALRGAYAAVAGQQVNALGPQTKKFGSLQQDDLTARLAELRHNGHGISLVGFDAPDREGLLAGNPNSVAGYLPAGGSGAGDSPALLEGRLGLFLNGNARSGSKATTKNSFAFDIEEHALTAGADYRVTDWLVAGAAYGQGKTKALFDGDLGRLDLNAKGVSLYASVYRSSFYLDILGGYGRTDLTTDRNLAFTDTTSGATVGQRALGKSHLHDLWAGLSIGDELYWRHLFAIPEASLSFHEVRLDGFTESMSQPGAPGSGLALSYGDAVIPSLQGRLGLRIGITVSTAWGTFQPAIHGAYIREFRNRADSFSARFAAAATLPGGADDVAYIHTDSPEGHYFANGAGLNAQLAHGFSAFVDYEQLRTLKSIKSHEFSFGLRYQVGE